MRIVTRPDFDGIVCAALLYEAEEITEPIHWVEPNEMQKGMVKVNKGDIIANLPYHKDCSMWFDHHYTNKPETPFKGSFKIASSAAGVVFEYYKEKFTRDYSELIRETDKIDSADLTLDQVLYPEKYPYILLSMTLSSFDASDEQYWNDLVQLLRTSDIETIFKENEVQKRCQAVIEQNKLFKNILKENTRVKGHVSITDFRSFDEAPRGNRFLVYSIYPETIVSVKVRRDKNEADKIIIGVGHSIFNQNCKVNAGKMLAQFGGGGHRGAGSCTVPEHLAEKCLSEITGILLANVSNE
ncbi:DHH phosphoesterase domain-containing protein [Desulfonema limicola]|uniref:DHH phosphoesterase domain-containing protein n=1 Tax=Desulfonema limicola TaxID=45656 RepID=A0A975B7W9_9BACT|nr:DHH family phosphoesterase [Desulfonema limicola]QTA80237.1 DHH phosphoesterase domain-containing protein [Desulfonema limicola]